MGAGSILSVVIPTLDEASFVGRAVESASEADEIIVVDGGSRDGTQAEALRRGARVIESPAGRGLQLDRGARAARGDWLVFLHADTRLEPGWSLALRRLAAGVCGGAFRFAVDSPRAAYRVIEAGVALRSRLLGLPYGDQAQFVRRDAYERIGGIPPIPLMEDVAFARRLGREGRLSFPRERAFTSARRWERRGLFATTAHNWATLLLYASGSSPQQLARRYARRG